MPEIRQAFADDLVDDVMSIDLAWIEQVLDEGKVETLARLRANRHYHYVADTIQEMEWWACFQPPRPKPSPAPPHRSSPASSAATPRPAPPPKKKKVGRNDPCPCGSGRKYKHCCGKPGR
jgi:preprotein translocase subunit SecA